MRYRRLVIIVSAATVLVLSLGSAAALITNGDAPPTAAPAAAPATVAPPSTTAETTGPAPPSSANTTPSTRLWRISDPAEAADHLYDAWRDGDRQRAGQFASTAAVDAMFAVPRDQALSFAGCPYRQFGFDCTYTGDSSAIAMRVEGGASAGYRVASVTVRPAID